MSPSLYRYKGHDYKFHTKEENRKHVHVETQEGEAKFWLEPEVELVWYVNVAEQDLNSMKKVIQEKRNDFISEWDKHFKDHFKK